MICPECRHTQSKVVDTGREGEVILRRRECKNCGHRFNTCEATTRVRGNRSKQALPEDKVRLVKQSNSAAVTRSGLTQRNRVKRATAYVEDQHKRSEAQKRRAREEKFDKYYSDEYVDSQVSDEEVKDLLELFDEYD